eukprot:6411450-Prymnesium_polylepis.1
MSRAQFATHKGQIELPSNVSSAVASTVRGEEPNRPCSPRLCLALGEGVAGRLPTFRRCSEKRIRRNCREKARPS